MRPNAVWGEGGFDAAVRVFRAGFVRFFAGHSNSSGPRKKMMSRGVHGHQ